MRSILTPAAASERATQKRKSRWGLAVFAGVSVFDALESELGLKLVKQKRSIPVIVVDHVDEKPIE